MKIHCNVIAKDLKKCLKKRWYPGIDKEIKNVVKLLNIARALPGEYPLRGFSGILSGRILHARIPLPDFSVGKRKGPRLVYFIPPSTSDEVLVVYVGGHKDDIYETKDFCHLVTSRYLDDPVNWINYYDFLESD